MSQPTRAAWIEIKRKALNILATITSQPIRAAWIEIVKPVSVRHTLMSQPIRAAWIEIILGNPASSTAVSRSPFGLRGLKSPACTTHWKAGKSQPSWAAWIEISSEPPYLSFGFKSQPSWAAWIEITGNLSKLSRARSQPTRAAWIEIV